MPCRGRRAALRFTGTRLGVDDVSHCVLPDCISLPVPARHWRDNPLREFPGTGPFRQCMYGPRPVRTYPGFMHILLRPVPVLSTTPERRLATTFLFAAAKCTNIYSVIPRQAPPAITGNKMAPGGTRKNTPPQSGTPTRQARREDPWSGRPRSGILQGRLVRLRYPRALLHRLPGARGEPARRARPRLRPVSCGS